MLVKKTNKSGSVDFFHVDDNGRRWSTVHQAFFEKSSGKWILAHLTSAGFVDPEDIESFDTFEEIAEKFDSAVEV